MFLAALVVVWVVFEDVLNVLGATEEELEIVVELELELDVSMVVLDSSVVVELSEVDELLVMLELCVLDAVVAFAFVAVPLTGVSVAVLYGPVAHRKFPISPEKAWAMIEPGVTPAS